MTTELNHEFCIVAPLIFSTIFRIIFSTIFGVFCLLLHVATEEPSGRLKNPKNSPHLEFCCSFNLIFVLYKICTFNIVFLNCFFYIVFFLTLQKPFLIHKNLVIQSDYFKFTSPGLFAGQDFTVRTDESEGLKNWPLHSDVD